VTVANSSRRVKRVRGAASNFPRQPPAASRNGRPVRIAFASLSPSNGTAGDHGLASPEAGLFLA
jgi:hypothetical protein